MNDWVKTTLGISHVELNLQLPPLVHHERETKTLLLDVPGFGQKLSVSRFQEVKRITTSFIAVRKDEHRRNPIQMAIRPVVGVLQWLGKRVAGIVHRRPRLLRRARVDGVEGVEGVDPLDTLYEHHDQLEAIIRDSLASGGVHKTVEAIRQFVEKLWGIQLI